MRMGTGRRYRRRRQSIVVLALLLVEATKGFTNRCGTTRANSDGWMRRTTAMSSSGSRGGDVVRASTGIRPSLHPMTINAISEALLSNTTNLEPIDVALSAGRIVSSALQKRTSYRRGDDHDDDDGMPTIEECQTIAGRVVGVMMRLPELERELIQRVNAASWVRRYGEHSSFGVSDPSHPVREDPLLRMCRAECLLALYLKHVEAPQFNKIGHHVPDEGIIDFLDHDRMTTLFPPSDT